MAITMTVCGIIGACIATNMVVGAIVGACIGAMLAVSVLYKIDPTVKIIAKWFGIEDMDIDEGSVSTSNINSSDYANTVKTKLILKYQQDDITSSEYLLNFANYGDNQYRILKNNIDEYLDSIIEPIKTAIETKTAKRDSYISKYVNGEPKEFKDKAQYNILNEDIETLQEELETYSNDVTVTSDAYDTTELIKLICIDQNLPTGTVTINFSYLTTPTDEIWCKYYLQTIYDYNYGSNYVILDDIEYHFYSCKYNTSGYYTATLINNDTGALITKNIPDLEDSDYAVVSYYYDGREYLWIKTTEMYSEESGKAISKTSYAYTSGNYSYAFTIKGKIYYLKHGGNKLYTNMYPTICIRHNYHFITEYEDVEDDRIVNETVYKSTKELLRKLGIVLDDAISALEEGLSESEDSDDADNLDKISDAFILFGIPFTTRTTKDEDNEDFEEPKILSKVLYTIFDTLNNNVSNSTFEFYKDLSDDSQSNMTLMYRQNPYYASLIWTPAQDVMTEEVIGLPGTYKHICKTILFIQRHSYQITWLGETSSTIGDNSESGGYEDYTTTFSYVDTVTLTDDEDNIYGSTTLTSKKESYKSRSSTYETYEYLDTDSESPTKVIKTTKAGVAGNTILVDVYDSYGNIIIGKILEDVSGVLYLKTVGSTEYVYRKYIETDEKGNSTLKEEKYGVVIETNSKKHKLFIDIELYNSGYTNYPTSRRIDFTALSYNVLRKRVTMEVGKTYRSTDIKTVAIIAVNMKKQITAETTRTISIYCPAYMNVIREHAGKGIIASENILDVDSNIVLPMPIDILKALPAHEMMELFAISFKMSCFRVDHTHLKWYETEAYSKWAGQVSLAATIVMTIASFGSNLTVQTFTKAFYTLIRQAAVALALSLVLKLIVKVTDNAFIRAIASTIAVVAAYYAGGGSFKFDNVITTGTKLIEASSKVLTTTFDTSEQMKALQEKQESITNAFNDIAKESSEISYELSYKGLTPADMIDIYSKSETVDGLTDLPSFDTKIQIAMEAPYSLDLCTNFAERFVTQCIDDRKQLNFDY